MHADHLASKQLVLRALHGQPVSRPPAGPLAVHYCAAVAGRSLCEYTSDPRVMAECVVRYYDAFRPDAVWLSADTWVTAEAMGAATRFLGDNQPKCGTGEPTVRSPGDVARIPPPDPSAQGRFPLMLDALRRIRQALGDDVFLVACFDQYPFSLACALMGAQRAMLALTDDRPLVEAVMDRALDYAAAYGRALADAGADMLSGGDSPAGLLGSRLYAEVALPWEKRLIARLKADATVPVSLHICGDATPILTEMASSGADVLELDHNVDMVEAARRVGPDVALWGNLDPVALLARGTAEQVRRATRGLIDAMQSCNHRRFILSSGCTLAVETPAENLHAMLEAARSS
jgi:uroporphyrinogen decarboxylase